MAPEKAAERPKWPRDVLHRMAETLDRHVGAKEEEAEKTPVNHERALVRQACLAAADEPPGLFSLTVPTGGGKTLSSLSFALRHALKHGMDRVVYVIPFTSIIEQNAGTFRDAMRVLVQGGVPDPVLEHHSNILVSEERDETHFDPSKLASENWDAPLVVTTSVQFYESLFANRTSRCRRLHNLSRAVIILDEVQTLPVNLLHPCLAALQEISQSYGSTVVLCTATQPAIHQRDEFTIGLKDVREIIPEPRALYQRLKRVEVTELSSASGQSTVTNEELVGLLAEEERALCIVNTRRQAAELFHLLGPEEGHFHLSALMCPEHRTEVLRKIGERLDMEGPCRVISTQLIEAGVDIDFPVVFRSMAGLDSIAQAAGRCNRNGTLPHLGRTLLFRPADHTPPTFIKQASNATEQVLPLHYDLLSLGAVEHFFHLHYWDQGLGHQWDEKKILGEFSLDGNPRDDPFPFLFNFSAVADAFRLIEDTGRPVIIPWETRGKALCEELRGRQDPVGSRLLRALQRFTVQVPFRNWEAAVNRGIINLVHDRYPVLENADTHYDRGTGLKLEDPPMSVLFS